MKDYFREISVRLLYPILYRSGLSANKITGLNFLILGLGSIILFGIGEEWLGLLTAGLMAMIDYVDGTIARKRGSTQLGAYLDTSLDWLYLMLLIGVISYTQEVMALGYVGLVAITFGNWVEFNGNIKYRFPFFLRPLFLLPLSIVIGRMDLGILWITIIQLYRTGRMYLWSIFRD